MIELAAKTLGAGIAFVPLLLAVTLAGIAFGAVHYRKYKDYQG